jgi:hypothetical protein
MLKSENLSGLANYTTARSNIGLTIGTNVQAYDADLAAIATLTTEAFGRSLLTQADAAAARTTLELETVGQAEAEAGTATTTRAWTAERVKQAIAALSASIGVGQTWQTVTRTSGVTYYNTTGRPLVLVAALTATGPNSAGITATINGVSMGLEFCYAYIASGTVTGTGTIVIPVDASYMLTDRTVTSRVISELR